MPLGLGLLLIRVSLSVHTALPLQVGAAPTAAAAMSTIDSSTKSWNIVMANAASGLLDTPRKQSSSEDVRTKR